MGKCLWYVSICGDEPDSPHGEVYAMSKQEAAELLKKMANEDKEKFQKKYPRKDIRCTVYQSGSRGWVWSNREFNVGTGDYDDILLASYRLRMKRNAW